VRISFPESTLLFKVLSNQYRAEPLECQEKNRKTSETRPPAPCSTGTPGMPGRASGVAGCDYEIGGRTPETAGRAPGDAPLRPGHARKWHSALDSDRAPATCIRLAGDALGVTSPAGDGNGLGG